MNRFTLLFVGLGFALGCSSGTTTTDAGSKDASADTSSADAVADGPPVENDCTTYTDRTASSATRKIQWDLGVTTIPERCMKIKAGQSVGWVAGDAGADFNEHPLVIYVGGGGSGTAPTVDGSGVAVFPTAGIYGFGCQIHGQMRGAILVE